MISHFCLALTLLSMIYFLVNTGSASSIIFAGRDGFISFTFLDGFVLF